MRLIHGDESPAGPGYKEREVPSAINGEYPGRSKPIHSGSYVYVPSHPELEALSSFTVTAWVFPTTPTAGLQGLVSRWTDDPAPQGFALVIGPNGDLGLHLADGQHPPAQTATGAPLHERVWTFIGASFDAASGRVVLIQQPLRRWPVATDRALITHDTPAVDVTAPPDSPLLFAALSAGAPGRTGPIAAPYNGKLDNPRLYNRALSADELTALADPNTAASPGDLLAAWDFSLDIGGYEVTDAGPHGLHGQAVNMPTRGVTGHNFTGAETSFHLAPREYGAIHFHDDDVDDVAWESDFQLTIPSDLPSGVYAARLRAGEDEDYLPFCVRPARGTTTSRIAVLMPTLTYVVYANFRDIDGGFWDKERVPNADPALHKPEFAYIRANGLPGLYERHSDGSGTTHVSQPAPHPQHAAQVPLPRLGGPRPLPRRPLSHRLAGSHRPPGRRHHRPRPARRRRRPVVALPRRPHRLAPRVLDHRHARRHAFLSGPGRPPDVPRRQRFLRRHDHRRRTSSHRRGPALGNQLALRDASRRTRAQHNR